MATKKCFFQFLTPNSKMTLYIFHRIFLGSKDNPNEKMRKIKTVASGYLMMYYFNMYWTPMRSIFEPQALKMCCKPTFGALKYAWKISAIYDKNCGFFRITPKKVIFWPKFKMPISAVLPIRSQNAFNSKSLTLRGSYDKNLGRKFRPPWAAIFHELFTITVKGEHALWLWVYAM